MTSSAPTAPSRPLAPREGQPTVLLLNPSGWGNLGDAAILDATIQAIRSHWPSARIVGVTLAPGDTEARHGIEGFLLAGRSLSGYGMIGRPERGERPMGNRLPGVTRLWRIPFLRQPLRFVNDTALTLLAEPGHGREAARLVAGSDLVVAAGGGQLDEFWGGPWGHPFALYKWGRLARRARVPFALISVGMCELETARARWLVRRAVGQADYRSFRDKVSSRRAEALGLKAPLPVVPDLAYGIPLPRPAIPVGTGSARRVGVSPIAYRDPRVWPGGDPAFFSGYVQRLAAVVRGLLADGCEVSLFGTDWCDWAVVEDLRAVLTPAERAAVRVADTKSVSSLLEYLVGLDLVLASRLHGLLLAQRAGRPTIALSYDLKVDTLMADMGLSHLCFPIANASADTLLAAYREMVPELAAIQGRVMDRVEAYHGRVMAQFDQMFGTGGLLSRR
ncbi:MAG TPA: polysaccharide pyruvyl transferase family protein [Gemmatimonadales bacterium]|nr:polysaccharide pyruvyl transferase family protein [Gemmatimonadales bacterium]